MELTEQKAKQVAKDLAELTEAAKILYFSDKEITPEMAETLAELWDLSQYFIEMYENYSRL